MIEHLKDDKIIQKIGGRFKLTALMQKRWIELMQGSRPLVESGDMQELEVIAEEIIQGKITAVPGEPPGPAAESTASGDKD